MSRGVPRRLDQPKNEDWRKVCDGGHVAEDRLEEIIVGEEEASGEKEQEEKFEDAASRRSPDGGNESRLVELRP